MSEETEQLLLRLSSELVKKIEAAASRFGHRSRNQVAAEVLELCLPIWEKAEEAKFAVLEQYRSLNLQQSTANPKTRKSSKKRV